jgi:hypothetical protein
VAAGVLVTLQARTADGTRTEDQSVSPRLELGVVWPLLRGWGPEGELRLTGGVSPLARTRDYRRDGVDLPGGSEFDVLFAIAIGFEL